MFIVTLGTGEVLSVSNISAGTSLPADAPPSIILGGAAGGSGGFPAGGFIVPVSNVVSIAIAQGGRP